MTYVKVDADTGKARADLKNHEAAANRATKRALERMGLFVEAQAVLRVKVNEGRLKGSIRKTDVRRDQATGLFTISVGSDLDYALYVEMGFKGHFVPFHIAEGLYSQARMRWGWRIPASSDIPEQGNKKWLIPRGRKRPVWGVFVSGKAHPFLRPALEELTDAKRTAILREEFENEF